MAESDLTQRLLERKRVGSISDPPVDPVVDPITDRLLRRREQRPGRALGTAGDILEGAGQGIRNFTGPIEEPLARTFGDIRLTPRGVQTFSPEEMVQILESEGRQRDQQQSVLFRAGELGAEAAALTIPFGNALKAIPKSPAASLRAKVQNILRESGESILASPITKTIEGSIAGFIAGGAGEIGARAFPDTPGARLVSEIIGGVVAPISLPAQTVRAGRAFLHAPKLPSFVARRGSERATRRFEEIIPQERRPQALRELEERGVTVDAEGKDILTPAQRSGDPGAMALEVEVLNLSQKGRQFRDTQLADANEFLQERLRGDEFGAGTVEDAQEYLTWLLDTRVRIMAHETRKKIQAVGAGADRAAANKILDAEVRRLTEVVETTEGQLFRKLPPETTVPTRNAKRRLQAELRKAGKVGDEQIPELAKRFLANKKKNAKGQLINNPENLGSQTELREMRRLQSRLRTHARNIREKDPDAARIADNIASAITDDLAQAQAGRFADNLKVAVDYSRKANDLLGSFTLRRLGGKSITPTNRPVEPGLAAERSLGFAGREGKEAYDQMIDLVRLSGDSPNVVRDAAEQYLRSTFLTDVVEQGEISVPKLNSFIQNHKELIDAMPSKFRDELRTAMAGQQGLDSLRARVGDAVRSGRRINTKVAKATLFAREDPHLVFEEALKMNRSRAGKAIQSIVNMTKRDETGEAFEGLQTAWVDFLLKGAKQGQRDIRERPFVSGAAIRDTIRSPQGREIMKRIFPDGPQRERLRAVIRELEKVEQSRLSQGTGEGVLTDKPGILLNALVRFVGVRAGSIVSKATPGPSGAIQTPGLGSNVMATLTEAQVRDPAIRLIVEGISEKGLFKDVLMAPIRADGTLPKKSMLKLNSWVAGVLFEYGAQARPPDSGEETTAFPFESPSTPSSNGGRRTPAPRESGGDNSRLFEELLPAPQR